MYLNRTPNDLSARNFPEEPTVDHGEITQDDGDFIPNSVFRNLKRHLNSQK